MIIFNNMSKDEKILYRQVYNQKNLTHIDPFDYGTRLIFCINGLKHSLVTLLVDLTPEGLKSMDEENFFANVINGASEKHTISKKIFAQMVNNYLIRNGLMAYKLASITQDKDNDKGYMLVADVRCDDGDRYTLADYYGKVDLSFLLRDG